MTTPPTREAESGWLYVLAALVFAVVGGVAFATDTEAGALIGIAVLSVSSLVATVGVIAIGVTVGVRRARQLDEG